MLCLARPPLPSLNQEARHNLSHPDDRSDYDDDNECNVNVNDDNECNVDVNDDNECNDNINDDNECNVDVNDDNECNVNVNDNDDDNDQEEDDLGARSFRSCFDALGQSNSDEKKGPHFKHRLKL